MLVKAFELIFYRNISPCSKSIFRKMQSKTVTYSCLVTPPNHATFPRTNAQSQKVRVQLKSRKFLYNLKKPIKSSSSVPRIKCVSCRIVIHESCRDQLFEEKQKIMCRPTYKEPLGTQSKFNPQSLYVGPKA